MDDVKNQQPEQPHVVGYMPDSPDGEPLITLESHEEFVSKLMQPGLEAWQKGRDGMREERDAQRLRADTVEADSARKDFVIEDLMQSNSDMTTCLAAAEQSISDTVAKLQLAAEMLDDDERGNRFAQVLQLAIAALNPNPEAESHETD